MDIYGSSILLVEIICLNLSTRGLMIVSQFSQVLIKRQRSDDFAQVHNKGVIAHTEVYSIC